MRRCILFTCLGLGLLAAPGCKPSVDDVCKVRAKLSPTAGKAFDHANCVASLEKRKEKDPKEFERYAACMIEAREPNDTVKCELGEITANAQANAESVCVLLHDNFAVWPEDKKAPCLRGEKYLAKKNPELHKELVACIGDPIEADTAKERKRLFRVKRAEEHDCLTSTLQKLVEDHDLEFEESGVPVCDATTKFEVACFEELPHSPSEGAVEHVGRKATKRLEDAAKDPAKAGSACRVVLARDAAALVDGCVFD